MAANQTSPSASRCGRVTRKFLIEHKDMTGVRHIYSKTRPFEVGSDYHISEFLGKTNWPQPKVDLIRVTRKFLIEQKANPTGVRRVYTRRGPLQEIVTRMFLIEHKATTGVRHCSGDFGRLINLYKDTADARHVFRKTHPFEVVTRKFLIDPQIIMSAGAHNPRVGAG
jgi:hypothetical protein